MESGRQLLHYRLIEKIGQGGMGEVWKALDVSLGRDVAVKTLPESFAEDAERRARLEREAKVLASLNHPNIAGIYGLHEHQGTHFLAMELVSGRDLAQRLEAGPLPLDEALQAAMEVAGALETAHENGIIHRDLKPANIQLSVDGPVKVLDFGLAKAAEIGAASGASPTFAPTVTSAGTATGVIMGTAAYMSPEQARGKPLDRRTDIWSFGCVLYEMLTAKKAFEGESLSDMLAAILKEEPDWDALPAETPARIRALLERMLRKDPKQRLRDIGDARIRIEECIAGGPPEPEPAHAAARRGPSKLPWGLAAAFAATALVAVWLGLRPGPAPQVLHASLVLPADAPLSLAHSNPFSAPSVEISPAGDLIVYVARQEQGNRLMIRRLESFDAVALPDTAFAQHPRFSPDGRWVAFHAGGKIRKVAVSGGAPVDLCDGGFAPGLSWGDAGVLVFPREYAGGLWTVPADGGDATPLSHLDTERGEVSHRWPHVLPGSKHVLYTVKTAEITSFHEASIAAVSLESGETHTVLENAAYPWYVDTGHLLYGRDGSLFAVPFDPMRVAITGTPVQVLGDMITSPPNGAAHFSVSRSGTLVYVPGSPFSANARLAWVDRDGSMTPLSTPPDNYQGLRFSPDGSRVAMQISSANDRIWILDLERETLTPLTSVSGNDTRPIWSPDGTRVAYGNDASGTYDLFEKAADGSGAREPLLTGGTVDWPEDWSPDGTEIAVARRDGGGDMDIWILPMDGDRDPFAFLDSPAEEAFPAFAPNGRWMAYASSDSGRDEVYVSPYPGTGGRVRISDNGGTLPRWSRDGSELYYGTDTHMMAVPVRWEPSFRPGRPRELFALERPSVSFESYDVGPDGRFLLTYVDPASGIRSEIRLITNWVDTLDRRE